MICGSVVTTNEGRFVVVAIGAKTGKPNWSNGGRVAQVVVRCVVAFCGRLVVACVMPNSDGW